MMLNDTDHADDENVRENDDTPRIRSRRRGEESTE